MAEQTQPLAAATVKDHPIAVFADVFRFWTGPAPSRTGANNPNATTCRWEWDIALSPADAALFDKVVEAARRGLTPAEYDARKADLDTCNSFLALPNPTTAQNAAAIKAIIRSMQERFRVD
jgi:hypothetical protein